MISIIICSVNPNALNVLKKNIDATIGINYEIIAIDNSENKFGICKAYNTGGAQARFPFLCFMHEDVAFETMNWGRLICNHFTEIETGLLGLAGGDTKSMVPSSWSVSAVSNSANIIQHYKLKSKPVTHVYFGEPGSSNKTKVIALDGVLLCTRKEIFENIKFDESTFPGFHGYDIDYSLQVGKYYNIYVVYDILVHHFSEGNPDRKWIQSAIVLCRKWKKRLPASIYDLDKKQLELHHWRSLQIFLEHLFRLKYNYLKILSAYINYSFTRFFSLRRFLSMGKYIAKTAIRKR